MAASSVRRGEGESFDEVHESLSNAHRRIALEVLDDAGATIPVSDLSIEVARRAMDATDHEVHCMMYHCHLPKLADAGLVEYDREEQRVALSRDATNEEAVAEILSSV